MMWFLLLFLHIAHVELVISQAEDKLILKNKGGYPCEGYLEVYHNNTWGYVGDTHWSNNTEKVVCKSTHCGEPVENPVIDILKPSEDRPIWLNELKCEGHESALWKCKHPGWNYSHYPKLTVKKITCSSNITISLNGPKCAGAVQYSIDGKSGYFCKDRLEKKEADLLCKYLGCGEFKEILTLKWMDSERSSSKMELDCSAFQNADPDHLWQCVNGKQDNSASCKPVSVICEGHTRLQLKGNPSNVCSGQLEKEENNNWVPVQQDNFDFDVCQQMHCGNSLSPNKNLNVTCTDEVKVVLKDSKCYGTVNIEVNDSVNPVCASTWTKTEAELVCKELGCGELIYTEEHQNSGGIMDHVSCKGSESSLWHCQAQHGKNIQCSKQPYVVCSDSVEVNLADGPGRCAGRLEIKHEGQWKKVPVKGWTDAQSAAVCKQLQCGEKGKTEKFSQGSGSFLSITCPRNKKISKISECLTENSNNQFSDRETEAAGITCEGHKVVFLSGTCSGHVGIEHGREIYWLSGSKETWNQESADTVCQQMHCGNASRFSFNSRADMINKVWKNSFSCSSRKKSLFECSRTTPLPPDHHNSTAYVKCSGNIEMRLTNSCWGKVRIRVEEKEGDMCADTWTEDKSVKLCEKLNCGTPIKAHNSPKDGDILFKSLHPTNQTTDLTQSIFVKNQDNDKSCKEKPAYVVCSGSVKPRFSIPSYKCFGNVEVEYEGKWIPVCEDALKDTNNGNTICQELKCGDAVETLPYFGPAPAEKLAISNLNCIANANSPLSACSSITASTAACKHSGLRCSEWRTMVPDKKACSGTVLVHWRQGLSAVSRENFNETEKEKLCQNMDCGGYQSTNKIHPQTIEIDSFWNKSFSCGENPGSIWECENKSTPSRKEPVFIECKKEPSVSISQGCRGEVRIDGVPVCASNWDLSYAHKVCQEKLCGNAVFIESKASSKGSGNIYHVSCEKYHSIIGQCRRTKGKCDKNVVFITCSESVKFRTAEKHGGVLYVIYRDKWERVCPFNRSAVLERKLCEEIKKENHSISTEDKQINLETTLEFTDVTMDIKRSVKQCSCEKVSPATIICPGYVKPTPTPTSPSPPPPPSPTSPPPSTSIAPIIVGVGFLLVVIILISVFIRFCVKRARKSKVSSKMLPGKELEFESGEYEDVIDKENEMEDLSHGRVRSEAEMISEKDGQSVSSLPYEDIEADEARPLTFSGTTAPAARDINVHEGVHNENGVTYEEEDSQESYDDIGMITETAQTTPEVHNSSQTIDDLNTAAPGLVERDEDYLEPDVDG
ncbi:scavenger receptor cysteine-rich type 1 protein M160-like [Astatotilapia calliptera]|uniref:scavenger receptor cysteine-rich type 1 protein M160-like n=1 Tax=Astatotilapia calliptera TaxID=8154 RepID=UPI000E3FD46C|nr:scavenger receptor cysteine-rich type 1 protein M160-like [Astatotilapia calliptera]